MMNFIYFFLDGGQDHVVLFDFADLVDEHESATDDLVPEHMGIFKKRCSDDISKEKKATVDLDLLFSILLAA